MALGINSPKITWQQDVYKRQPMSMMVASGKAASLGILFRDAAALETVHKVLSLIHI